MSADSNPLVAYMEARPEGWKAAREAIKAGLTKEKDRAIMLDMTTDLAMICNTVELKQALKSTASHGEVVDGSAKLLHAALQTRDAVAGRQIFLISQANGDVKMQMAIIQLAEEFNNRTIVWTKDSWNMAQMKSKEKKSSSK